MSLTQDVDDPPALTRVLDAIDRLLDAIEAFEAPVTRDLLRTAMVALVQECRLQPGGRMH